MKLNRSMSIVEVQDVFSKKYEGLKLKFYQKPHAESKGSYKSEEWDAAKLLGDINPNFISGQLSLNENKTIGELEQEMEKKFGLHVQVFRRSNNLWLQTTSTDHWTLKVQNSKGLHSTQVTT